MHYMSTLRGDSLQRSTFKYLEDTTYEYHDTLKQIEEIEQEIIHGAKEEHEVQAGRTNVRTISDDTAERATALTTDRRLQRLKEKSRAVEKAYSGLIDEKKELIELYYWQSPYRTNITGVAQDLNIAPATAYRWRREYINRLAVYLGEM